MLALRNWRWGPDCSSWRRPPGAQSFRARLHLAPGLLLVAALGCARLEGESPERRTLVVGFGADEYPLTLNRERVARYPLNADVCEPLVRLAPDYTVVPGLAARWEPIGVEGLRLHLLPHVVFSDGTPFDARAAAHTLQHGVQTRTQYSFLADTSVRILDDSTLEIRPAQRNRRLLEQLVHSMYAVFAPTSDPASRPICTGPFRVAEYRANDRLTVVRNERYRGPRPRLDTIVFRFIPDETTRTLALRAGEVDVIFDVGRANAAALARAPRLRVVNAPLGAVVMMYMNRHGARPYHQLRDSTLRRAVALAIDRRALAERVLGGAGRAEAVATVNPPRVLGEFASLVRGLPYDPAEARRLLAGRRPTLRLIAQPNSIDRATVEFVQAQLAAVGIRVVVESLDAAAFESRLNAGAFDLDLELPNQNDANPAFLLTLRWYSGSNVRSARYTHAGPRFDTLVVRAMESAPGEAARRAAAAAMHQLVDVEVGALPLAAIARLYAMHERVRGFTAHPSRLYQEWRDVWLAR